MSHTDSLNSTSARRRKLHARFTPVMFSLYMAAIMALLMCALITAVNRGINGAFIHSVWQAYQIAMPCAFICVLLVRPLVFKLVQWTVHPH